MKRILAMTVAAFISVGPAQAQTNAEPLRTAVSYSDLNLMSKSGRKALEERIAAAVSRVCPERPMPQELRRQQSWRACQTTARNSTRQQLAKLYGGAQLATNTVEVSGAK